MTRPRRPRIDVTIDRLVLEGFAKDHLPGVVAAFEAELRRSLTRLRDRHSFRESRSQPSLRPAPIGPLDGSASPARIGAHAARRIAQGLGS